MSQYQKMQRVASRQTTRQNIQKQTEDLGSHHRLKLFVGVVLIAVTLAIFWPVQNSQFIDLDDNVYVTHNRHVQSGLTWESVIWAFTTTHSSEWHPLTWLSHMADYELYELNPRGHHLTNLLFHTGNVLILFLALSRMLRNIWVSGLIAMLFAVHPLRVESVAWVAERKDVLSTFFWILSVWAYTFYVERGGIKRYLSVILCFVLGLMAKPMTITLPLILLLLDYWPLGRFQMKPLMSFAKLQPAPLRDLRRSNSKVPHMFVEKIPFVMLSVFFGFLTLFAAETGGAVKSVESYPVAVRFSNALVSYVSYIGKTIWPHPLACFYPYRDNLPLWQVGGAGLLLLGISIFAIRSARKHPYFLVGWLWYLVTLVPVIGLVQAGDQAMADRFTYLPHIGLLIIAGKSTFVLSQGWHYRRGIVLVATGLLLSIYGAVTRSQIQHWRNSMSLFEHAIEVTSNNYLAHNNLGTVLAEQGEYDKAISHYRKALRIKPDYADAHYNLASTLSKQGKVQEAIEHYKAALRITPHDVTIRSKLGVLLASHKKYQEAMAHFEEALRIDPGYADAYNNIGVALLDQGHLQKAITYFREALRIRPNFQEAHFSLCMAYLMTGRQDLALEEYKILKTINPNLANLLYHRMSNEGVVFNLRD